MRRLSSPLLVFVALLAPALAGAQNDQQRAKIDSLQKVVETTGADTTKARSLCRLCAVLKTAGQTEAALAKARAGLETARRAGDLTGESTCLKALGSVHFYQGDYPGALDFFQNSLQILRKTGDRRGAAGLLRNIGIMFEYQGDYTRALASYHKSLKILKALGDEGGSALSINSIGVLYFRQGDYDRALDYLKESLSVFERAGNLSGIAASTSNIGGIYKKKGNFSAALNYYRKSLDIYNKLGELNTSAAMASNIGNVLARQGDFTGALDHYQKSLKVFEETGDQNGVSNTVNSIALLKLNTGAPAEAGQLCRRSLEIALEIGAHHLIAGAAELLAKADSALGDYKSAYAHYKLFKQYSDSLNNESQSKEIGRLEAKYEFDKQIEERERLEAEAAERRQMYYWIAAGVFAALLLVAGLLVWGFRTKQKANKQLALQNAEIRQQSEEISQQRDELQAMNAQITEQRDILEKAHLEITDSIDYASRIQHALLPSAEAMRQNADVFVYYKARDVVSGDFYWTHRIDEETALYSAADCTGHGVPGAFMSVLGATTLDTIVREYGETRPDRMLKLLDESIRQSLKQDEIESGSLDGMDLALIKLDKKNRKLYFSSAGRPLFLLRNGEIIEYKGAKFPAGGAQHGEKEFPLIEIELEPGDRVFMCSDGITDQFGGPRGRKFSPRRLKEALLAHQDKPLQAQGAAFAEAFDGWQSTAKQLDDQLLIGLAA